MATSSGAGIALVALIKSKGAMTVPDLEFLTQAPFFFIVKETKFEHDGKKDYPVLIKYHQLKTKFPTCGQVAIEARGIILRVGTWEVVCYPFDKFFNADEPNAKPTLEKMDWSKAIVQEKYDGSLIKVWWSTVLETWVVSTNGCIDAAQNLFDTPLGGSNGLCLKSWRDLFDLCASTSGFDFSKLTKGCTYCFEIMSEWNKIVVNHPDPHMVHIGTRDAWHNEVDQDIGVPKPKVFPLGTLAECVMAAKMLTHNDEGYVVTCPTSTGSWPRVKVKGPAFVKMHHARAQDPSEVGADLYFTNEIPEMAAQPDEDCQKLAAAGNEVKAKVKEKSEKIATLLCKIFEEVPAEVKEDQVQKKKYFAIQINKMAPKPVRGLIFRIIGGWKESSAPTNEQLLEIVPEVIREQYTTGGTDTKPLEVKYDRFFQMIDAKW